MTTIHEELREAILLGLEVIIPASDRLEAAALRNAAFEPVLLEITEAFEAFERALALLDEHRRTQN